MIFQKKVSKYSTTYTISKIWQKMSKSGDHCSTCLRIIIPLHIQGLKVSSTYLIRHYNQLPMLPT